MSRGYTAPEEENGFLASLEMTANVPLPVGRENGFLALLEMTVNVPLPKEGRTDFSLRSK